MRRFGIDGMDRYIDAANAIPLLTREEEAELGRRCMSGDMEARHELVRRNLRLVLACVRRYSWKFLKAHMEDLIAEGNAGLFRATRDFDPSRAKFSTIAVWWIRQRISRYLSSDTRTVRVPDSIYQIRAKIRRGKDLTPTQVHLWANSGRHATRSFVSLDSMPPEDRDKLCAEPERVSPFDEHHRSVVQAHLGRLGPRNREIVVERLSMGTELRVLGQRHGISGERVRQIVDRFIVGVREHDSQRRHAS